LELHEDDWRQVELVSQANQAEIDGCLAQIRRIYTEARTDSGFFQKIHVRKEVARPLEGCQLAFDDLRNYFDSLTWLDGLAYRDVAGLIEGGFACETASGMRLYGLNMAGTVTTLGLVLGKLRQDFQNDLISLTRVMSEHELCLVDWCRVQQVEAREGD